MDLRNRFGGQAVIEGVMMRGAGRIALAVRRPDGSIHVTVRPHTAYTARRRWLGWPVVRGVAALAEALVVGIQALNESARLAEEPARSPGTPAQERAAVPSGQAAAPAARPRPNAGGDDWWVTAINVVAVAAALVFFILLPTWAATALARGELARNVVEGGVRLALLLGYMAAIGRIPDIRRVYEYHGAEHKAIHALEAGAPLEPAAAQGFSRFHPRCGTAFLLFVAVVAVVVHALFGWPGFWQRTLLRLATVPVVAGLAYEWILLAGGSPRRWVRWMSAPGLWLQRLTTAEPSLDQLEVALAALKACLAEDAGRPRAGMVTAAVRAAGGGGEPVPAAARATAGTAPAPVAAGGAPATLATAPAGTPVSPSGAATR
ncbi:protein of unknown function DUF1385 [Thermaerobacter marianensis DSM 12885]|uniref:DUF1385 domain-containing protein n=1 Tax=Thermaerobacter marianensis (strain ATCC 700841 / DSM 12885 / JCM 10246 / 7p75a) TaxID=644966 RepID=E6SLL2_THEM7|nr:DUF1385 domain-containing protein [Thermaerobacter marianensis]ADU50279.1 protein of unknown function DUF1385 [Thermaerobacter marianensis DSM 12885]